MGVKRYYWLKLSDKFFYTRTFKALSRKENGDSLIVLYLRMMTSSLEADGFIEVDELCDSLEEELALDFGATEESITQLLDILKKAKEVEITDSGLQFINLPVGSEGDPGARERKRREREKKKEQKRDNVGQSSDKNEQVCDMSRDSHENVTRQSRTEKEIEKEKEIETETEIDIERETEICPASAPTDEDCRFVQKIYNEICLSLPPSKRMSKETKSHLKTSLYTYSFDDLTRAFEIAEASDFLKGYVDTGRNWKADFDWLVKKPNLEKLFEGRYNNAQPNGRASPIGKKAQELEEFYGIAVDWAMRDEGA